jgi:hypothetical protein
MSKRSQEKRRARAKEKKRAHRRLQGADPLSLLAETADSTCECWSTYAEQDNRIRSLIAFRPLRTGGHAAAYFLIDYDCLGLKDAFVRTNVDIVDQREWLRERSRADNVRLLQIALPELRSQLASAVRWTRSHPFSLPPGLDKCLRLIGGMCDPENADISDFGTDDGGLFYFGYESDLARRLIDLSVDEFMERDDVECLFVEDMRDEDAFTADEDEPPDEPHHRNALIDRLNQLDAFERKIEDSLVLRARQWCIDTGHTVESGLRHVARALARAVTVHHVAEECADEERKRLWEAVNEGTRRQRAALPRDLQESYDRAMILMEQFLKQAPLVQPQDQFPPAPPTT